MFGNLVQADAEGFLFPFLILFHLAQVFRRRLADDGFQRLDDIGRIDAARRNDDMAEFHAPRRFDDDAVIELQFDFSGIEIIYFSGRFKTNTYNDHIVPPFNCSVRMQT